MVRPEGSLDQGGRQSESKSRLGLIVQLHPESCFRVTETGELMRSKVKKGLQAAQPLFQGFLAGQSLSIQSNSRTNCGDRVRRIRGV